MLRTMWKKLQGMPDLPMKLGLLALYVIGAVYVGTQQEAWHTLKDGRRRNGSLLYTILPPEQAVEQFNRQQLAKAEAAAERRRIQDTLAKQAAEAPPSPL